MTNVGTADVTVSLDVGLLQRFLARAHAEGISLSALVNRELSAREAAAYFAASERIHRREGLDLDALGEDVTGDVTSDAA
jgi:hypothetical protein